MRRLVKHIKSIRFRQLTPINIFRPELYRESEKTLHYHSKEFIQVECEREPLLAIVQHEHTFNQPLATHQNHYQNLPPFKSKLSTIFKLFELILKLQGSKYTIATWINSSLSPKKRTCRGDPPP